MHRRRRFASTAVRAAALRSTCSTYTPHVPYVLLGLVAVIALAGTARLKRGAEHDTPWAALMMWAMLLGTGVVVWLYAARLQ